MKRISALLVLALTLSVTMAQEQPATLELPDDRITTDRPTFGRSGSTIGRGIQIEAGVAYNWLDDASPAAKTDRVDLANILLRVGLSDDFEFRLGIRNEEYIVRSWTTDAVDKYNTWSPMEIGIKARFIDKAKFDASLLFNLYVRNTVRDHRMDDGSMVPGALARRPSFVSPEMAFLFAHDMGKFGLEYNVGLIWNGQRPYTTESGTENPDWYYTLTASYELLDWLTVFVDHASYMRNFHFPDVLVQGGLLMPFGDHWQVDVHGGAGLNEFSQTALFGGGLSYRF